MTIKPLEISKAFGRDSEAAYISTTWSNYKTQMQPKVDSWKELRNYIFATDTTTTTNKSLPGKNSTTLPKLCQIRDNLHSNYISALFPNDDWLKWEAYSKNDNTRDKVEAIEAYMGNKTREGHFRMAVSKTLYDYIDYGNVFATVEYESAYSDDGKGGKTSVYQGPRLKRISPLDIVFNPLADDFMKSWKIIRSLKSIGELKNMADQEPDNAYLKKALLQRDKLM